MKLNPESPALTQLSVRSDARTAGRLTHRKIALNNRGRLQACAMLGHSIRSERAPPLRADPHEFRKHFPKPQTALAAGNEITR